MEMAYSVAPTDELIVDDKEGYRQSIVNRSLYRYNGGVLCH